MGLAWRVVDTGANCGAYNMGVDQVLAAAAAQGPVLRFYDWNPPAVSCGWNQQPEREANVEACRALGIDVVRRPTGGRAVLHWEELTYSVACTAEVLVSGGGIEATHRKIGACLAEGLRLFGAPVELERAGRCVGDLRSGPCFGSTARWELKCQQRKLVGSAQRRYGRRLLQHGSILLGRAHERLPQLIRIDEDTRQKWTRQVRAHSTDLQSCMGRPIDRAELIDCLVEGFSRQLGAKMHWDALADDEVCRAGTWEKDRA